MSSVIWYFLTNEALDAAVIDTIVLEKAEPEQNEAVEAAVGVLISDYIYIFFHKCTEKNEICFDRW